MRSLGPRGGSDSGTGRGQGSPPRSSAYELQRLERAVLTMHRLVSDQIADAIQMLTADPSAGSRPVVRESVLDALHARIEDRCFSILTRRPRLTRRERQFLGTVIRIATALERIGDAGILMVERSSELSGAACPREASTILQLMAANTLDMVARAVGAFSTRDREVAAIVRLLRPIVDGLGERLVHVVSRTVRSGGRTLLGSDMSLLVIASYLEEIAGHAVSIADRVTSLVLEQPRHAHRSGHLRSIGAPRDDIPTLPLRRDARRSDRAES